LRWSSKMLIGINPTDNCYFHILYFLAMLRFQHKYNYYLNLLFCSFSIFAIEITRYFNAIKFTVNSYNMSF
jgi:hypothetical protein